LPLLIAQTEEMHRNINEVEFTIFDTETTGLEPQSGDRVVEIAGIRFKADKQISNFHSLVNPHRRICEAAAKVNNITEDMLISAPDIKDVLPEFLKFSQGSCMCAYNAPFDMDFLANEARLIAMPFPDNLVVADILRMARRLVPNLERYALWFVAQKFEIESRQTHRAFSDVELTWEVFKKLRAILEEKSIADYASFISLFGIKGAVLDDITNQKIAKIQEAMDLGVKIKIKYLASTSASITERIIEPSQIRKEYNSAYLIGYCDLREDERLFRIDGILHLEII